MNIRPEECRYYFCIEPSNFYRESEIALESGESHTLDRHLRPCPVPGQRVKRATKPPPGAIVTMMRSPAFTVFFSRT